MTEATFRDAVRYGAKYLIYNISLFVIVILVAGNSVNAAIRGGETSLGIIPGALIGATILVSGLMGELYMLIADAVDKGNQEK